MGHPLKAVESVRSASVRFAVQSVIEKLESRRLLSIVPFAPPAGSTQLTGTLIGTAGSYQSKGNTIAKAMDGDPTTYFDAPSNIGWVGLDLGTAQVISQVQYVPRSGFSSRMVDGVFQGSTTADFSSGVTTLLTISKSPAQNAYTAALIGNATAFRYVRYLSPTNGEGNVAELEFDGVIAAAVTAAPDVPNLIGASAVSSNDVHLSWTQDNVQPTDTFFIERQSPADSSLQMIASVSGSITSYDDLTVSPNTQYSYAVFAKNSVGGSDLSSVVNVTTPAASLVPAKLSGTVIGTSGSYQNLGNVAAKAFDGSYSTFFDAPTASGGWVGLDLGSTHAITQVKYAPRSGFASRMVGGVFQASNTADFSSGVVTLFTITTTPATGSMTSAAVVTNGGFRYVRYLAPANGFGNVSELEFDGYASAVIPIPANFFSSVTSWANGAPSPIVRAEAVGATVNGKIYVFGGFDNQGSDTTTIPESSRCDVYDPATNTWTRLQDFPEPFTHSEGVVVGNDIWFVGGYVGNHPGPGTTHVWIYDTTNDTWTRGPDLPQARGAGAAALVGNSIYFTGGMDETRTIDENTTWALDLNNQSAGWVQKANLPDGRNHVAGASVDGCFYVIGGQHGQEDGQNAQSEVDRYDPSTDTWTQMASIPAGDGESHITEGTFVYNGYIVVVGGETAAGNPQRDVIYYNPASNTWNNLALLPAGRSTVLTGIINGKLIVTTGNSPSATTTTWIGTLS